MQIKYFFFLLFFASSCQTLDVRERAEFSEFQKAFFASEDQHDGFQYVEIFEGEEKKFSGDLEWIVEENQAYSFELLAPLGKVIAKGKSSKDALRLSESFGQSLTMRLDSDGFLYFQSHWIALKSEELAFFLKGGFPPTWLKEETYRVGDTRDQYYLPKGYRDITVDFFPEEKSSSYKGACAKITWNSFWLFKTSTIFLCFSTKKPKTSWINLDNKVKLKIKDIYEDE